MDYFCENGAFHGYECCDTCWNKHPIAKKYEDGYFNKEARTLINEECRQESIKDCRQAGFTKKQAEYLCRGKGANFQQYVM